MISQIPIVSLKCNSNHAQINKYTKQWSQIFLLNQHIKRTLDSPSNMLIQSSPSLPQCINQNPRVILDSSLSHVFLYDPSYQVCFQNILQICLPHSAFSVTLLVQGTSTPLNNQNSLLVNDKKLFSPFLALPISNLFIT